MFLKFSKLVLLLALVLLYRWLTQRKEEGSYEKYGTMEVLIPPEPSLVSQDLDSSVAELDQDKEIPISTSSPPAPSRISKPDDLKKIEGVGPKIAAALYEANIQQFSQLEELTPDQIRAILNQAGIKIANPDTWPEQAAFAAREDWDGLEGLQAQLKGGRRS